MNFRAYTIISQAVEAGTRLGYARAHKHVKDPKVEDLIAKISDNIMDAICEVIEFSDADMGIPTG